MPVAQWCDIPPQLGHAEAALRQRMLWQEECRSHSSEPRLLWGGPHILPLHHEGDKTPKPITKTKPNPQNQSKTDQQKHKDGDDSPLKVSLNVHAQVRQRVKTKVGQ